MIRCVDGDTVDLDIDLGFHLTASMRCRLLGVDTPERGQADFDTATVMLETLLAEQQDDEGFIDIITRGTGKYGRWLVEVEGVNSILAETWPYDK